VAKTNRIEIIINAEDKASSVLGGVGKALGGLGKIAAGAGLAVAGAAAGIGVALGKLAVDAAPLEGIGFAFDKMADRVGLSLDELRTASAGTVSDFELMRKANIALTGAGDELGAAFGKNLPKLMEAARAAAKATGQDVDFLFESLVTGVKRGSPMLIDNTGLVVKLGEANEAMAAQLGKSVEELTAEEKSIALLNATVEAGKRMVDEFGGGTLTAAEQMAQLRAQLQNTKDQIGIAMLPALQALMEPLGKLAQEYGPQLVEWAQVAGQWLGENLPVAIEKLTALLSGEMPAAFQTAWGIIEPIVLAIRDVVVDQVWPSLQAAFSNLTEALGKLGLDWGDVWSAIGQAIEIVAIVIGGAILGIIGALTGIITAIASVAEHVTATLSDIADTFMLGLESICQLVGGAMAIVKGIFSGDLDLIMAGWEAWKEGLIGLVTALFEGIINLFNLSFGTLIAAVSGFISSVIAFFTNLKEALVGGSIVPEMMDLMASAISTGIDTILGLFADLVAKVIEAVSGLGDELYGLGQSIMDGLKSGIESKVQDIVDSIRRTIQSILDEAKDALDIFSPSGVFMDIGKNMMEGMALGIGGSAGLPAMAAVGAASNVSRTVNNYFNQTINTRATTDVTLQGFETLRALYG